MPVSIPMPPNTRGDVSGLFPTHLWESFIIPDTSPLSITCFTSMVLYSLLARIFTFLIMFLMN